MLLLSSTVRVNTGVYLHWSWPWWVLAEPSVVMRTRGISFEAQKKQVTRIEILWLRKDLFEIFNWLMVSFWGLVMKDLPGGQDMVGQHWSSAFSTTQFLPTGLMKGHTLNIWVLSCLWWLRLFTWGSTSTFGYDKYSWDKAHLWLFVPPRCSVYTDSSSLEYCKYLTFLHSLEIYFDH